MVKLKTITEVAESFGVSVRTIRKLQEMKAEMEELFKEFTEELDILKGE